MKRRRVVITGLGAVTPYRPDRQETAGHAVRAGVCGIAPITQYDASAQKVKLAAEVKGFEPEELLGRQEARRMDRFTQFAVVCRPGGHGRRRPRAWSRRSRTAAASPSPAASAGSVPSQKPSALSAAGKRL